MKELVLAHFMGHHQTYLPDPMKETIQSIIYITYIIYIIYLYTDV